MTTTKPTTKAKSKEVVLTGDPVRDVLESIRAEIGKDGAMCLGDDKMAFKLRGVVSTGCMSVDRSIGRGGIPLARLTIFHGGEGSGKTTAALHVCANAQKAGGVAVYIDKEYKLDPDWAKAIGVNTKKLIVSQPKHLEATLKLMRGVINFASKVRTKEKKNYPIVVVLDSINACKSKAVYEADEEDNHVAPEARVWSKLLPGVIEAASRENVCLIFISQVRKKINVMFGDDAMIAGGEAPKFFASCIGFFKRIGSVKKDGVRSANQVEVEWKKNQIAPPFRKSKFYILFPPYGAGFDFERSVIDAAEELHLIKKKGRMLKYRGKALGEGYDEARETLLADPALTETIASHVRAVDQAKRDGKELVEDKAEKPEPTEDDEAELDGDEAVEEKPKPKKKKPRPTEASEV